MTARPPLSIPDHLEEPFLAEGPRVLSRLVERAGGRVKAAETAQVATSTLSRWLSSPPGRLFGPRQAMRPWRSVWFGYPSPFPGLDRMVEEIYGPKKSFIQVFAERSSFDSYRSLVRRLSSGTFGLLSIGVDPAEASAVALHLGVPPATYRRWLDRAKYPFQWSTLDRLSVAVHGFPWIEVVVRDESKPSVARRVPVEALSVLVDRVVSRRSG